MSSPQVPPPQRRRSTRDLSRAAWLRPRDIWELYGISPSTLCKLATQADTARRPVSKLIHSRSAGRKGMRLFPRRDFEAWLECWDDAGNYRPPPAKAAA